MVAQPYLGDGTIDYRVYVVDGEPVRHDAADAPSRVRRSPTRAAAATWPSRRPRPSWSRPRRTSPTKLPDVPFFCVDFLHDGERYWFSELEPDGVIAPEWSDPDRTLQRDVTRARWTAYRNAHARFLEARP